jgi:signal transduction histidine kinase
VRPRLILALTLLVLAPIGSIGWLGGRLAEDNSAQRENQLASMLQQRLRDQAGRIDRFVAQRQRDLEKSLELPNWLPATIRERVRQTPWLSQIFYLGADGRLQFPPPKSRLMRSETAFVQRTEGLWSGMDQMAVPASETGEAAREGWYTWYWQRGLHLLFWRAQDNGDRVGAELDRTRLLADLLSLLPATDGDQAERIVLRDARGKVIYQWGSFEPPNAAQAHAKVNLATPLEGWHLQLFMAPAAYAEAIGQPGLPAFAGLLGLLALALLLVAVFFYRESTRELREAGRRVSFVNQVSHELKTPLTNIRMYAELLEDHLEEDDARAQRNLQVIVSESARLSRLIGNVLSFGQASRSLLTINRRPVVVDEVISEVLEQFAPLLQRNEIAVIRELDAAQNVLADPDALGQVIANLLSNVAKYAADGGVVRVASQREAGRCVITVTDDGAGIPQGMEEQIFQPFVRGDDRLTEGVSGTGIGLALARTIARLHGGDLRLVPREHGACFAFTFAAEVTGEAP